MVYVCLPNNGIGGATSTEFGPPNNGNVVCLPNNGILDHLDPLTRGEGLSPRPSPPNNAMRASAPAFVPAGPSKRPRPVETPTTTAATSATAGSRTNSRSGGSCEESAGEERTSTVSPCPTTVVGRRRAVGPDAAVGPVGQKATPRTAKRRSWAESDTSDGEDLWDLEGLKVGPNAEVGRTPGVDPQEFFQPPPGHLGSEVDASCSKRGKMQGGIVVKQNHGESWSAGSVAQEESGVGPTRRYTGLLKGRHHGARDKTVPTNFLHVISDTRTQAL